VDQEAIIRMPHDWLRGATNREAGAIIHDSRNIARHENAVAPVFQVQYDYHKGAAMNIFEAKEAKIKAYLKFLNKVGATTRKKAVKIEVVEQALKIEDRLFDEITKYLVAEGSIQRSAGLVSITKTGISKL
jgi:hypothetical protein